jgi:hypothetical protein
MEPCDMADILVRRADPVLGPALCDGALGPGPAPFEGFAGMSTQADIAFSERCRSPRSMPAVAGTRPFGPNLPPRARGGRSDPDTNGFRAAHRPVLDSPPLLRLRRAVAVLHYRLGAETWLNPHVAVISHPKSGRTWLRVMLEQAGIGGVRFSHAGSTEEACIAARAFSAGVRFWSRKRILLLIRDPRDTVVSFYFQATRRSRVYSGEFAGFLRDPRFGIERIMQFNLLWLRERGRFADFILLAYEDLHADPGAALRKASAFLSGRQPPESEMRRAVRLSAFDEMRRLELSGAGAAQWGVRLTPGDPTDPESFKTRRGVVGGWRDYFTAEDEAYASDLFDRYDYYPHVDAARQTGNSGHQRQPSAPR